MRQSPDTLVFTLCSNNYLAYAKVLSDSMKTFEPEKLFVIGLVDRKRDDIPYEQLGCPVVEIETVEKNISHYAEKYSIVELNTFAKPTFFQFFFDHFSVEHVIFLDPDTCLFDNLSTLSKILIQSNIVLTPHILSPVPLDESTPEESLFLNYGIFNFGFLALRKSAQSFAFLAWWKERTYNRGFDRPAQGLFTDQIWGNLVPVFFQGVHILRHAGFNMALWNLHERSLTKSDTGYLVKGNESLVLYHFSGVLGDKGRILRDYARYSGSDRPDLHTLYALYRSRLQNNSFFGFMQISCYFANLKNDGLPAQEPAALPASLRSLFSRAIRWMKVRWHRKNPEVRSYINSANG